jgi:hypothetical protein
MEMSFGRSISILLAKIFEMVLYITLQRLIGLTFLNEEGLSIFGMREMKVDFQDRGRSLL